MSADARGRRREIDRSGAATADDPGRGAGTAGKKRRCRSARTVRTGAPLRVDRRAGGEKEARPLHGSIVVGPEGAVKRRTRWWEWRSRTAVATAGHRHRAAGLRPGPMGVVPAGRRPVPRERHCGPTSPCMRDTRPPDVRTGRADDSVGRPRPSREHERASRRFASFVTCVGWLSATMSARCVHHRRRSITRSAHTLSR
jgi:hypothetical protein